MKSTVMDMCSKSSALYSLLELPRCSMNMFVIPYVKIKALSTNSAEGRHFWPASLGRTFHACIIVSTSN